MQNKFLFLVIIFVLVFATGFYALFLSDTREVTDTQVVADTQVEERSFVSAITLPVPSITQIPFGTWADPWGNACEEASISMIAAYYEGKETLPQSEANKKMQEMFVWQNKKFKTNSDTNAEQILALMVSSTPVRGSIQRNPTLEEIKEELRGGHPVIAMVDQFKMYNIPPKRERFASFHVFVIIGFDNSTGQFIVNDPAKVTIKKYAFNRIMDSLRDLGESGEADGAPTVIFTQL